MAMPVQSRTSAWNSLNSASVMRPMPTETSPSSCPCPAISRPTRRLGLAEAAAEIDDGDDGAAEIDHALEIGGRVGNRRDPRVSLDLLNSQNLDGILLGPELERQELTAALRDPALVGDGRHDQNSSKLSSARPFVPAGAVSTPAARLDGRRAEART